MPNKISFIITIFAILSMSQFAYAIAGFDQDPNFVPKEEWSIKYIQLFKQAIEEKYNIDDETLNNNLIIISVTKGTKSDGFAIPFTIEKLGKIHYIYKIDWALYNGLGIKFDIQDDSGNDLIDQQILDNMKSNLFPIFTITNIISKEQAVNSCSPSAEFPSIEFPWYSNDNNIRFDEHRNELVFYCYKTISTEENKCLTETFSLETGEKLDSSEGACFVYSQGGKGSAGGFSSIYIISIVVILVVIALIVIFVKRRK
ncbi:MAG: hypothetical protein J4473_04740 [Candidatus Aenigmarchaeota archaeon]|nr:hypothetical protein [Candidatus Aenigmarchaeota archaeon]